MYQRQCIIVYTMLKRTSGDTDTIDAYLQGVRCQANRALFPRWQSGADGLLMKGSKKCLIGNREKCNLISIWIWDNKDVGPSEKELVRRNV